MTEPVPPDWFESFFVGPWVDVHSRLLPESRTEEDVATIVRYLGAPPPARILDIACGDGRIAVELAARGYRVTGIDLSEPLLGRARSAATARGVELDLEQRDMRDLPWRSHFDGALSFWSSFGYFDDESNEAFLAAVAKTLTPGGWFLLQTILLEALLPQFVEQNWTKLGDTYLLEARRLDLTTGRIHTEWTFVGAGAPETADSSIRVYSYPELARVLTQAGFAAVEAIDVETGEPAELPVRGRRMLVRARRR